MNRNDLLAALISITGAVITGSVMYRLGIKDNEKLSKAREDTAFDEGRILNSVYVAETLYRTAVKYHSQDEKHIEECENKFQEAKKDLEQMGLWEKYRETYPEED